MTDRSKMTTRITSEKFAHHSIPPDEGVGLSMSAFETFYSGLLHCQHK